MSGLGTPSTSESDKPVPAVVIKKSVTPGYIVGLEDGRHFKSLKRHLSGKGMTPADYRAKWGLPKDYPMVAPNYAAQRSELAKALGLGQQRRKRAEMVAADTAPKAKRGRPRKPAAA
jgi:predicted transcriptional regulator